MMIKIFKYLLIILLVLIVLAVLTAAPFVIKARNEGNRLYAKYDSYTQEALAKNFQLKPHPIKQEFQKIHPLKALKLFKIVVHSQEGDKLSRVNSLDATIGLFMKMYTLLIRPDYHYNLPMLSVDFIFIGGKRVFVIEVIDPARIQDENTKTYYDKMRVWMPEVKKYEQMETNMEWCKDMLTDFCVHIKADRTKDDVLFEIYKTYPHTYMDMAKHAEPLSPEQSKKVQEGIEGYVSSLLAKGGPAVNVFKTLLGPEKQEEYVRTVMFGID